jgi:hypothetical protein
MGNVGQKWHNSLWHAVPFQPQEGQSRALQQALMKPRMDVFYTEACGIWFTVNVVSIPIILSTLKREATRFSES